MGCRTLYVFNPEHDLALAVGNGPYTPPKEVANLRKLQSLLPALYAGDGDILIVPDDLTPKEISGLPHYDVALKKNLRLIPVAAIPDHVQDIGNIVPWGWDFAVRTLLADNGAPQNLLPDDEKLENIRRLSHRRTTIPFRQFIAREIGEDVINAPRELFSLEQVEEFLKENPLSYFKAPWSSSGRGIVVSDHISEKGLREWAHGILRRQGSLMAETAWQRTLDFATEWRIAEGKAEFEGYSVFETSSRGKYHRNISASQWELLNLIKRNAPEFDHRTIEAQKAAIENLIAPDYEGPLGIDMLADNYGKINPCVELNLRMTMGFVAAKFPI